MQSLRRILLGRRLSSEETQHTKISNPIALAVFSSDALSSVAYATQEIMASLSSTMGQALGAGALAGATAYAMFGWSIPVALSIVGLLAILAFSYRQTILAYPGGGGAYIVAMENLGDLAALTAGASLLLDYILTVAVSASSGVAAITAALPAPGGPQRRPDAAGHRVHRPDEPARGQGKRWPVRHPHLWLRDQRLPDPGLRNPETRSSMVGPRPSRSSKPLSKAPIWRASPWCGCSCEPTAPAARP